MNITREAPHLSTRWAASLPKPRATVVLLAAIAALAVWVVAVPILGTSLAVQSSNSDPVREIGPVAVGVTALVAGLAAWVSLAGLERLSNRGNAIWVTIAVVVLAASMFGPVASGTSTAAQATLVLLHLAVGAVLISGLPGATGDRPRAEAA